MQARSGADASSEFSANLSCPADSTERLLQEIRYGLRQLIPKPGCAALAIISMALGIGANTSIFSLLDTALLRPLRSRS